MSISGNHSGAENHSTKEERADKAHEGKDRISWPLVVLGTVSNAMDTSASNFSGGDQYKNCQNSLLCTISLSTMQQSYLESENHRMTWLRWNPKDNLVPASNLIGFKVLDQKNLNFQQ